MAYQSRTDIYNSLSSSERSKIDSMSSSAARSYLDAKKTTPTTTTVNNVYKPPSGTLTTGSTGGTVSGPSNYTGSNSFAGLTDKQVADSFTSTKSAYTSPTQYNNDRTTVTHGNYTKSGIPTGTVSNANQNVVETIPEQPKYLTEEEAKQLAQAQFDEWSKGWMDSYMAKMPQYNPAITQEQLMGKYNEMEDVSKNYNPTQDPIFNAMSDQVSRQMLQQFARRGLGGADFAQGAIAQKNLQLGVDFKNQRQDDLYNQLNTLRNMEATDYSRYRNNVGDFGSAINFATDRKADDYKMEQDRIASEINNYGFELTGPTRQLVQTFQQLTPDQIQYGRQYEGNYAARMNQLDPSSQEYQMLNAMRFNKILSNFASDPETYGKYLMQDYGLAPNQIQQMIANSQLSTSEVMLNQAKVTTEQFKAYIEQIKAQYTDATTRAELEKIQAQADKANTEALMAQIEASYLPAQLKQELALAAAKVTTEYNRASKEAAYAEKAQSDLQDLSPQTQAYYGDYLEARKQNPNLSPEDYLISIDSYKMVADPTSPRRQTEIPVRKIDMMSNKEWQEFLKYAVPEEDIAATIERLKSTLGGG